MKPNVEDDLLRWLSRHHGVLTLEEARRLGISEGVVAGLVRRGRLERRHAGVYVERPPREAPFRVEAAAALAAAGPHGALSHRSAAWGWGLLSTTPARPELLVPYGSGSGFKDVIVHRSRPPFRSQSKDGLRLTEPARTVLDIAATSPNLLTAVVDKAVAERIVRLTDLELVAKAVRNASSRGAPALRRHLAARGYVGAPAPSVLESHMARLFVQWNLPRPEVELVAGESGEYRLDFAYPKIRLAIEVDGYAWHWDPDRMAADLARRNRLINQGWRILTFTWKQVLEHPDEVIAEILAAYHLSVA